MRSTWITAWLLAAGCGETPQMMMPPMHECEAGESRCNGAQIERCDESGAARVWSVPVDCPGEQSCHDGACKEPTAAQLAQADTAAKYVDLQGDESAWHQPLSRTMLKAQARRTILTGDGSDLTYFTALRLIHLSVGQGHQSLFDARPGACKSPTMFAQDTSRFGVCGRPRGDAIVITYARAGNPLGLTAGDQIVQAGGETGAQLLEVAARRPVCGTSSPSTAHRRTSAAASFFGTVPAGMELTVRPVGGGVDRKITVPAQNGPTISCQDPLGRSIDFEAKAELRPDGVAVIRLPRFYPRQPVSTTDVPALIQQMMDAVQVEFDKVKSAPAIVWDARSNYGGITTVGLAITSGMPSARATQISYCNARIAGTDPPEVDPQKYAIYSITPGGAFAYAGKVVVITDGLDYSAADYFAYAIKNATDTQLVGSATAGAYGGSGALQALGGTPAVSVTIDVNRCVNATTGVPLEGTAVLPHLAVDYDPADLAAGRDTVLEAAVALVK
jgi:C-terminal processing protease CtpA/Prc